MKQGLRYVLSLLVLSMALVSYAQKYTKGAYAEFTKTSFINKKISFQLSGEKLVSYGFVYNTEDSTQTIHVKLFNPDYAIFKEMSYVVPDSIMINMHEGGIKVFENIENGKPVFYFAFNALSGFDFVTGNKASVIREDGVKTCTASCSWMGFKIVNLDGTHKLVSEYQQIDTIHFDHNGRYGTYTHQFGTSSVYDIQTGALEHTFPRGTTVISVDKVNDSYKYFTTNDYYMRSLDPDDPWGKFLDVSKVTEYNADFSVWQDVQAPIPHFGMQGYEVYSANLYQPLVAGNTVYYIHQVTYQNENYDYKTYNYLTNHSGALLSATDKSCYSVWHMGDEPNVNVQYLPLLQKYAIINYDAAYSLPELDSLGQYNLALTNLSGGVKFINFTKPEVRILNNDFSLYKSFLVSDSVDYFNGASQLDVVDDNALELFFTAKDSLLVYNEDGKLLMDQVFTPLQGGMFNSGNMIIFNLKNEKYGRFSSTDGYQYMRTMPLTVRFNQENQASGNVQLYQMFGDSVVAIADTLIEQNLAIFDAPEGKFAVQTKSTNDFSSTFYPSTLFWEQAGKIDLTADDDSVIDLVRIPVPNPLNAQQTAGVSGKLIRSGPIYGDFPGASVYVQDASNQNILAGQDLADSLYTFSHLPNGTYKILVTIPGYELNQAATVVLNGNQLTDIDFSIKTTEKEIQALNPTGLNTLIADRMMVYPNPVVNTLTWQGVEADAGVQVLDASGHVVLDKKLSNGRLDVSMLASGVYVIRGVKNGVVVQARLIKK